MTDITASAFSIAEVCSMDGLIKAFRARAAQLNVSYETIDHVCGFATRYTSKLLSLDAHRHVGPMSFDALVAGLGVRLVMVEDPEALAKVRSRLIERDTACVRTDDARAPVIIKISRRHMRKLAKLAATARQQIPPRKRRRLARLANRERNAKMSPASAAKARVRQRRRDGVGGVLSELTRPPTEEASPSRIARHRLYCSVHTLALPLAACTGVVKAKRTPHTDVLDVRSRIRDVECGGETPPTCRGARRKRPPPPQSA